MRRLSAQVAQLVEQRTENPRVAGSIPALGTTARLPIPAARRGFSPPLLYTGSARGHRAGNGWAVRGPPRCKTAVDDPQRSGAGGRSGGGDAERRGKSACRWFNSGPGHHRSPSDPRRAAGIFSSAALELNRGGRRERRDMLMNFFGFFLRARCALCGAVLGAMNHGATPRIRAPRLGARWTSHPFSFSTSHRASRRIAPWFERSSAS